MEQEKEDQVIDENQDETLDEIINPESIEKIKLKIPENEFNDEKTNNISKDFSSHGSISSGKENKKMIKDYGYTFNINGFEINSIAYFNEILLKNRTPNKSNLFNVKFNFKDGNIFNMDKSILKYINMVLNSDFDLEGDIDGVITNIESETILYAKKENPYNMFMSNKFLKPDKTYDIFCESTFGLIEKLSNKTSKANRKLTQLKKLIFIIELIQTINKEINESSEKPQINLKVAINKQFHHNESNEIILCIIVDGNYKKLIEQMKNSCLFSKQWKNWENPVENKMMKTLYDYFEILRKSKVPFIIIYCPRFYERTSKYYNPLSKRYIEDNGVDSENRFANLDNENALLKLKIASLEERIKKLEEERNNPLKNKDILGKKRKIIRNKLKAK